VSNVRSGVALGFKVYTILNSVCFHSKLQWMKNDWKELVAQKLMCERRITSVASRRLRTCVFTPTELISCFLDGWLTSLQVEY